MTKILFLLLASGFTGAQTGPRIDMIKVQVLDEASLQDLEQTSFSLGRVLGGAKDESSTAALYKSNALYRSFADQIGRPIPHDPKTDQLPAIIPEGQGDIPDMVRAIRGTEDKGARSDKDLKGGYFIRHISNNSSHPYLVEADGDEPRHFDYRWLSSSAGSFRLAGVVNRMDRADFEGGGCGDVRFIYRLSYAAKSRSSLPFFVTAVMQYPKSANCAEVAKRWKGKIDASGALKDLRFHQLEVNFQSLRFTSGYMHDFGGQAMYMQRIFRVHDGKLVPVALENTPDVTAIRRNPVLMKKFVEFLKAGDNLHKLDNGTLVVSFDPTFLAKLSVSWSTLGRVRTANKPYRALFQEHPDLLKSIDISKLKYIRSHDALVERLDNLTCMGCHQSGGTAGFHVLGNPRQQFSHGFNRQAQALSPHAFADSLRRMAYVTKLAKGEEPNRFRPHSTFSGGSLSLGQLCLLNSSTFAGAPGCAPVDGQETECVKTVAHSKATVLFGECAVKETAKKNFAGSVCWKGEITEDSGKNEKLSFNLFAFKDKWKLQGGVGKRGAEYACVLPQSGAPLGRSSRPCSVDEENFSNLNLAKGVPAELCANQGGNGFDMCAASGDSGECLESRVVRSMLDTCHSQRFCREDYICQEFPEYHKISNENYLRKKNGKPVNVSTPGNILGDEIKQLQAGGIGFCVPTYFLFNMRLDGHPSPVTAQAPGAPKVDRSRPLRGYK